MKFFLDLFHNIRIRKARKQRHERTFYVPQSVFLRQSVKQVERVFFWRVITLSTLGLFFFSIIPRFAVSSPLYMADAAMLNNFPTEQIIFSDDGFMLKPEVWTEVGDRSDVGGAIEYTVQPNDTIGGIAQKFGVTQSTIQQNNDFPDPKRLRPGSTLMIPATDGLIHNVEAGETLSEIAAEYDVEIEKIKQQNELIADAVIRSGQSLIIPGAEKAPPAPALPTPVKATGGGGNNTVFVQNAGVPAAKETFGQLLFPTQGKYTQFYHYGHYAVDIAQGGGAPIWAAEGGTVIKAASGWNGGYGNVVIIDHGNGMRTLYAHLREMYVNVNDQVGRGTAIGYMGNTGRVYGRTGIHLHFEVIVNGTKKNPLAYF
jgi:murein DD-endopeptidase MepM/ murein hydrolase activator NlpD